MRIIGQRARVQVTRSWVGRVLGLFVCLNLCACAARFILHDGRINEAKKADAGGLLRVYVSHRTITVYDRDVLSGVVVRKQFDERELKDRLKVKLGRNTSGVVVEEDRKNGQPLLWVSFARSCQSKECAFGFVRTEDQRYRLMELPERDTYSKPRVYRSCTLKRQQMKLARVHAISDANQVYELQRKRKRKLKTVFLEFKRRKEKRIRRQDERLPGQD